jgi:hypothetical protein
MGPNDGMVGAAPLQVERGIDAASLVPVFHHTTQDVPLTQPKKGTKRTRSVGLLSSGNRFGGTPAPSNRASLRGVTSGTRSTSLCPPGGTCWVFVENNLDVLLGALTHGGLSITRVFVRDPSTLATVVKLVHATGATVAPWDASLALEYTPCTLALISHRASHQLFDDLAAAGVVGVLSTGGYRRHTTKPWRMIAIPLRHSNLGGVTSTEKTLHLFLLVSSWNEEDLDPPTIFVPRDMSTLLSYGEEVLRKTGAPALQQVEPLRAHSVKTDPISGSEIYHGRGLLPASPSSETLVLTPAAGAWGIRSLSRLELLQAYDIGDRFQPHLPVDYNLSRTTPISMVCESLQLISSLLRHIRGGGFYKFFYRHMGGQVSPRIQARTASTRASGEATARAFGKEPSVQRRGWLPIHQFGQ